MYMSHVYTADVCVSIWWQIYIPKYLYTHLSLMGFYYQSSFMTNRTSVQRKIKTIRPSMVVSMRYVPHRLRFLDTWGKCERCDISGRSMSLQLCQSDFILVTFNPLSDLGSWLWFCALRFPFSLISLLAMMTSYLFQINLTQVSLAMVFSHQQKSN